ncbi:MAG TPA: SDR family oxidoreductase [Geminicoccaceae bacterium]|nr:SDR family oxidoreductase [Geminicoccaceae bacterium]
MAPRSAFVTGGTGFIGLNLIEQLTGQGWAVTALHRPTSDLRAIQSFPVRPVAGDLLDPASLRRAIPPGVDALFHLAADVSVWSKHDARQTRINVEGTRNVVEAALAAGVRRMVHTSTWNAYGLEQGEISEDSPQQGGRSWINYDRTKFLAEEAVREGVARGLDAVIVNPAHVIGRYDRRGWARLIIAAHRRWLPGVPPGAGTFCHAQEVALAHIAAALRGRTGQNYLLSGKDASFVELFRAINRVTGSSIPLRPLPAWLLRLSARAGTALAGVTGREPEATPEGVAIAIARARVVSRLAEHELGYQPVALHSMIEDSYRWLRAEGLLGRR